MDSLKGIRYYKSASNTGTHIGQLWTSTGTLLGQATFTGETSSGWQQVNFTSPVAITAGVTYIAAYHSSAGNYSASINYFTSTVANGPLKNLANGEDGPNGLYRYTSTPAFPNSSYSSSNYWVDVVFNTGSGSDVTPPTVVSTTPAGNATGVSTTTSITAVFSEALSASSVTGTSVYLRAGAVSVPATLNYTAGSTNVILTPSSPLSSNAVYTVTFKGGTGADKILDVAGNALASDYVWSFTTGDFTPPTVVSTSPATNATGVAINASITAVFSEPLSASSLTASSVYLRAGATSVAATLSYTAGSTNVVLTPSSPLNPSTVYTVTLKGGTGAARILDIAGNALAADYVWSFTTVDQAPPTVLSTTPASNATGVATTTTITALFSEALRASSVTAASVYLRAGATSVPATLSYTAGSTNVTLTPSSSLTANTVYTVTLKGGTGADKLLDVAGNALAADYIWSFTTAVADLTAPVSVISSPSSGATVTQGIPYTITGTATDAGTITQVQVSVNGGTTWQVATGTTSWSFSWTPSTTGTVTIKSRATDQAGNVEVAGTAPAGNAINVTVVSGSGGGGSDVRILTAAQISQASSSQPGNDGSAIELGVKFRASSNGFIKGIRYYKSASNTGTHIGQLWTSTGTLLGQATFTGETSSGWQQVNFTSPVAITAGVTYIAAYHSSAGNYSRKHQLFYLNGCQWPAEEPGKRGRRPQWFVQVYQYTSLPEQFL